jgi:hypothetical protein
MFYVRYKDNDNITYMQAKSAETFTSSSTFLLIVLYVKQASTVLNVNKKFNYKKISKNGKL